MDLAFSDEELRLRDEVRAWLARNVPGAVDRREKGPVDRPESGPVDRLEEGPVDRLEEARAWQAKLASAGWVGIDWPAEYGGRGASPLQVAVLNMEYARSGAPQLVNRVGINLAAATLLSHGTPEQCRRYLPSIADASEIWCQLFSEPGAGSDLTGLATRAEPVSGGWLVSGQKVWTSYALVATFGLCLARTSPGARPAEGLSLLVVDMGDPGVTVRPLVQITGDAEFNEVFLEEVFVPDDRVIGQVGRGWQVASTTLAHERGTNFPFKEEVVHEGHLARLVAGALDSSSFDDPAIADAIVDSYALLVILRTHNWRTMSKLALGAEPGPESSIVKLTWSQMTERLSEAALDALGPTSPTMGPEQRQWLWSKAAGIAGGTSEIQKNVIAERILGLPREPA